MRDTPKNGKTGLRKRMRKLLCGALLILASLSLSGCVSAEPDKPRLLISTDIGGTDPDDFQSLIHFLIYCDRFETEGLISSPSYGEGKKEDILGLIDLYEKDLPRLKARADGFPEPEALRQITKQGRHGGAPYCGYSTSTEGSEWIVRCARQESDRPLWVLVWGGLDDLAQALHDAPDIQEKIRVYWIGGPNKKWSANSYAYIAEHFPGLWLIENNSSYRGFFPNTGVPDSLSNDRYYEHYAAAGSHLGQNFKQHYGGRIKMGDTPSLLYMLHGDPTDPAGESWGGSFERMHHSPRTVFNRPATLADTVAAYSVAEFHFEGPHAELTPGTPCCTLHIAGQSWEGIYRGEGRYVVRYAFKQAETLSYTITSELPGFTEQTGQLVVANVWPGERLPDDYPVGPNWFTDRGDPQLFAGKWQGGKTVLRWRTEVLLDWAERWKWLAE